MNKKVVRKDQILIYILCFTGFINNNPPEIAFICSAGYTSGSFQFGML